MRREGHDQKRRSQTDMQPSDGSNQCPASGAGDGGRDAERRTLAEALAMALAVLVGAINRPVRVEPNSTVDLSATLTGSGRIDAQ